MTNCSEKKAYYCMNACCYISRKKIFFSEIEGLGIENIVESNGEFYLKNKDSFGACVFLNEEEGECNIYERRPIVCRTYSCQGSSHIELFAQEITHYLKNKNKKKE